MINITDTSLFSEACHKVTDMLQRQNGIGTLREKTIHSVLKYYYAPDLSCHEVKIGQYIADICIDEKIFEVQTRNFNTMRSKLTYFLQEHDVTIIYPVAHTKWLIWLNPETGELSDKRKSPKTGTIYQIIPELYKIKMFVSNPRLHFIISLLDVEETRYLNGWSRDKKRGSERMDGIPVGIFGEVRFNTLSDYTQFLPGSLDKAFTSKDLAKAAKIPQNRAATLLNVLLETGTVIRTGKNKNFYLYEKNKAYMS